MSELFYLQDSRTMVGNDMMWWRWHGKGYTTDLRQAHVYTKEEAMRQHESRPTDVPWPKDYIDARTRPAVDFQHASLKEALRGTGIKIKKEKPPRKWVGNCVHCGGFINDAQRFYGCPKCGGDNAP